MIRATTPTHTFTFPELISSYSVILITYVQNDKIILEKNKSDLTIDQNNGKIGSYTLTQEETKKFGDTGSIQLQIRAKDLASNSVLASNIIRLSIFNVLDDKEL